MFSFSNKYNLSGNLKKAVLKADILIGVSVKRLFKKGIIQSMNPKPVVFALANPDPELTYLEAKKWGVAVYANGRSDCRNQINNALVFPGFFKGLLKRKITKITDQMKLNAAEALTSLVKNPTANHFIPSIFDKRVVPTIEKSIISTK